MHINATKSSGNQPEINPIAVESMMLELFAPADSVNDHHASPNRIGNAALWRSDAIHRAKNLAQLTMSLAHVAEQPSRCWLPPEIVLQTRSLARAYDELGNSQGSNNLVPCGPLLIEIATRLTAIFGRARDITVIVKADPVSLPPDTRRALLLMASEMLINALKYAYSTTTGGDIRVNLTSQAGDVALVVEDDGKGFVARCATGQGSKLLEELARIAGASLSRSTCTNGSGYRIAALMPNEARSGHRDN